MGKDGDHGQATCAIQIGGCGRIMLPSPKDLRVPIPGSWECVTVHGKRDCADVIKMGHYPSVRNTYNQKGPYRREAGGSESEKVT